MNEIVHIFAGPIGWILWSLGGWDWVVKGKQRFKHGKLVRRLGYPFWAAAVAYMAQKEFGAILYTTIWMVAFVWAFGYGDKSKLRQLFGKYGTWCIWGVLFGLTTAAYGLTWWNAVSAATFPVVTYISQKDRLQWTIASGFIGLIHMLTIVH